MPNNETPRIATIEEFTHAIISIVRTVTIRNGQEWMPYDQIKEMLTARDAAIRAECAERAVAYCKKWAEFPIGNHGLGALRDAIMEEQ
jgi:hypothetical protein